MKLRKQGYDLTMIRPILSTLRSKDVISDEEEQALLSGFAESQELDRKTIENVAGIAANKAEVVKQVATLLREDVGEMEDIEPKQPVNESQAPAELVNELLSSNKEVD